MRLKKEMSIVLLCLFFICTSLSTTLVTAAAPVNTAEKNLVVNGNCEQGLTGWENTQNWQIIHESVDTFMPKAVASAYMYQDVLIDNLPVGTELQLSALMYSFDQSPTDVGTLTLDIFNSDGTVKLASQSVQHSSSVPTTKSISMLVPKGAKYARITLQGQRRNGGDLNTYFTNVSLFAVSNVKDSKLKVVLEINEQLQLSIDRDLSENINGQWISSNPEVASVDTNGLVKALTEGNTKISVTYSGGTTEYIDVLVVDDASEYRLAVDLVVGQSSRLTIDDYSFTQPVTWTAVNNEVATISDKGKVTAVGKGLTLITAKDDQGQVVGQIYIRVRT